jgi:hypothetical protein
MSKVGTGVCFNEGKGVGTLQIQGVITIILIVHLYH